MSDKIEDSSSLIHVVAFIDILGSSQILLSEDDNAINNYLAGIDGLNFWARNEENGTVMFSDNVLIYSEGNTADSALPFRVLPQDLGLPPAIPYDHNQHPQSQGRVIPHIWNTRSS